MRIIVDAFGGDNAPLEILKGSAMAVQEYGVELLVTGPEAEITYFIEHGVRWFVVVQGWVYNDVDGAYRTYLREQFPVAATGTNCVIYDLQGE